MQKRELSEFPKPIRVLCSWISLFASRLHEANPDTLDWDEKFSVPKSVLAIDNWMDDLAECLVLIGLYFERIEFTREERKVRIKVQWTSEVASSLKLKTPTEMAL